MKIKLDENLPATLVGILARLGHEADTVVDEGLKGEPDEVIWPAAQNERRFLVTQDLDFSDIRKFAAGTHRGLMLARLRMSAGWAKPSRKWKRQTRGSEYSSLSPTVKCA